MKITDLKCAIIGENPVVRITTDNNPSAVAFTVDLSAVTDPGTGNDHAIGHCIGKSAAGGRTIGFTIELRDMSSGGGRMSLAVSMSVPPPRWNPARAGAYNAPLAAGSAPGHHERTSWPS